MERIASNSGSEAFDEQVVEKESRPQKVLKFATIVDKILQKEKIIESRTMMKCLKHFERPEFNFSSHETSGSEIGKPCHFYDLISSPKRVEGVQAASKKQVSAQDDELQNESNTLTSESDGCVFPEEHNYKCAYFDKNDQIVPFPIRNPLHNVKEAKKLALKEHDPEFGFRYGKEGEEMERQLQILKE